MFHKDSIEEKQYSDLMEVIKKISKEKAAIYKSKEYIVGKNICMALKKPGILLSVFKRKKLPRSRASNKTSAQSSNYFSDDRIAVYTCVTGNYDVVDEPYIQPDNVDYFYISDVNNLPEKSKWKFIDIADYQGIEGFSSKMINRYFKLFPEVVFKDYDYSIYIDGNVVIHTDLTEFVNEISDIGLCTFLHPDRTSIEEEAITCKLLKKDLPERIDKYLKRLEKKAPLADYKLLACTVLVRKHNTPLCREIMKEWWNELRYIGRDQLALPYVLHEKNIDIDSVGTLGYDMYSNGPFHIKKHDGK